MDPRLRPVYRLLLRTARLFDGDARLKSMLGLPHLFPQRAEDVELVAQVAHVSPSGVKFAADCQAAFLGRTQSYHPGSPLVPFVRSAIRAPPVRWETTLEAKVEAAILAQRRLVWMAAALTKLLHAQTPMQSHFELPDLDAAVAAPRLSETTRVAPGVVMLSHAQHVDDPRAVRLVLDVDQHTVAADGDEDVVLHTFVLNRPLPVQAKEVFRTDLGLLGDAPVFEGGRSDEHLYLLHRVKGLVGSELIREDGLYTGGNLEDANRMIADGLAELTDFKVLLGSDRFRFNKAQRVFEGAESAVFADGPSASQVALLPPLSVATTGEDMEEPDDAELARVHQDSVWSWSMRQLGGEYAEMATVARTTAETLDALLAELRDFAPAASQPPQAPDSEAQ
jgi:hypothetical protein